MSDFAAPRTQMASRMGAHGTSTEQPYPRPLVVLGVLGFCLSFWAVVIFAAVHYG
jgi:hypothetical protein